MCLFTCGQGPVFRIVDSFGEGIDVPKEDYSAWSKRRTCHAYRCAQEATGGTLQIEFEEPGKPTFYWVGPDGNQRGFLNANSMNSHALLPVHLDERMHRLGSLLFAVEGLALQDRREHEAK